MATTPSSGQPVGTIKVVIGDVKIVGVDGVVRVAHVGDKVFAKEVLITAANAVVQVQLENGNLLDMGRSSELALDGEILDAAVAGGGAAQPPVQTAAQAQQDVAALQAAIAAGVDPTKIAEATAAGAPGAGGVGGANDSGSHEPVVVQQGSPTQAVTAGFDTQGPPAPAFPTLQTQLLPPEQTTPNAPPAVTAQLAAGNVFEAGLPGGSSPGAPALTVTGTFQLSDPEGLSTITNLQINNVSIPIANLVGSTVAGTAGTLVVTGYNAATGAGTFQYTLKVAVTDVANAPELETFSFAVSDDSGATFSLPASVSINIVDDLPLARPDTNAIAEDAVSVSGNVLTNDSSFADAPASFVAWGAQAAQFGTITQNADGSYVYALNNALAAVQGLSVGQSLTETFGYTMRDADGDTSSSTLTITINGTNDGVTISGGIGAAGGDQTVFENDLAAGSSPDAAALTKSGTFTIDAKDGIATVEVGGATLTAAQLQALGTTPLTIDTLGGVLVLNGYTGTVAGGTVNYSYTLQDPVAHAAGAGANSASESFAVKVTDKDGSAATSTLSITIVDDLPLARADANTIAEDTASVSGNVLTNDSAFADAPASLVAWGPQAAQFGTITQNANGTYVYALNNALPAVQALGAGQSLTETFGYTMKDADGDTSASTLTITITGTNDAPVAVADTNAGDAVIEAGVNPGNTAFAGDTTAVGNVLTNDTDVDTGDTKAVSAVNGVAGNVGAAVTGTYGSVTIGADGAYTYTLNNADPDTNALAQGASVTDQFTYTMRDASGATSSSTLTITITGTNDAPVAVADTNAGDAVTEAGVSAGDTTAVGNVLTNDTDVDTGDTKAVSAVNGVAGNVGAAVTGTYGSVTIGANGAYTYTLDNADPDTNALAQGASVTDQFTYTMRDANGATSSSTLTITITGTNDAPVAVANTNAGDAVIEAGVNPGNTAFAGDTTAVGNVLTNDTDVDTGDTKAVSAVNGVAGNVGAAVTGTYGSVTIGADGAYTYTLNNADPDTNALAQGASVTDQFTYTMRDANGATSSSTLTITITGTNDAPVAVADTNAGDAVTEAGVSAGDTTAVGNVLTNDTDVDTGDTKAVSAVNGVAGNVGAAVTGTYGSVTIGANGAYTYTLDNADPDTNALAQGASVTDQFTYTMRDANGATSSSTLTITITGTNDAPVAVANTNAGDAVIEAGVNPGNTAFAGDTTAVGNVLTNDTDVDTGDTKAVSAVNGVAGNVGAAVTGTYGSVTIGADGAYTYTLNNADPDTNALAQGASVTDQFTYTMRDANGATSSSTLTITITGTNDAPVAVADTGAVSEAGVNPGNTPFAGVPTATGNVLTNDTDVDTGDTKAVSAVAGVAGNVGAVVVGTYGSVTIGANGAYTYTLNNADPDTNALAQGAIVTDQFAYTMRDANGATSSSTLTVTITGTNDLPVVVPTQNWVPSDPAQQTPNYTNGYPLWLTLPTDVDNGTNLVVKATGVIPAGVFYDAGAGYVALTAGTTLYDAGGGVNYLNNVVYRPTVAVADTVDTSLSLSVFDGFATVTQTVGIHEVGPNRLPSQIEQIGDGSHPLNSGSSQTIAITLSQALVDSLADLTVAKVVVYTDFQESPFVVPVPAGEQAPGVFGDASAGSHREQEVQVEIRIGANRFAVVEDDLTAGTFEPTWTFDSVTGLMKATVGYTDIHLLDALGDATAVTLKDYLTTNAPAAGDSWTLAYTDNAGGNYQAREVKFEFFSNDPGDPGIVVNPDGTVLYSGQNDQIYGTSSRDVLTGGAGDDRIDGRADNDILNGGGGNDILTGGTGSDTFRYTTLADGVDTIVDFDIAAPGAGGDVLDISAVLDLPGNTWVDGSGVAAAIAGGYVSVSDNGGKVQVNVDNQPGTPGGEVSVAVLQNVPFVSAADALTKLTDNLKVD